MPVHLLKKMINNFIYNFLTKSPNYVRRSILIIVDILLISISFRIGIDLSSANFNSKFYLALLIILLFIYLITGQYKSITRFIDNKSLYLFSLRTLVSLLLLSFLSKLYGFSLNNNLLFILLWIFISLSLTFVRVIFVDLLSFVRSVNLKYTKVAIYGAGEAGNQLLASLKLNKRFKVIYFFDDSEKLKNRFINDIPIKDPTYISKYASKFDQIFIAIPSLKMKKMNSLLNSLSELNMPVLQIPSIKDISSGKITINSLRPISIENVLGRDPVPRNLNLLKKLIINKVVCITGAGGSIGSELCRQIIELNPKLILLIDMSEYSLYTIQEEICSLKPDIEIRAVLGNLLDLNFLRNLFKTTKIDIVFHTAAYKHVPLVEKNPYQGIHNNVFSTLNLCKVSDEFKVNHLLLISSDKAVRPTNIMGASKRIAELIFQAYSYDSNFTKFCIVRFGNVLGSSGSVVPKFYKQIAKGGPVTITHPDITRYFMTITEASLLVIQSLSLSKGGDILLLDMGNPIKIKDLAIKMIKLSGLTIKDKYNLSGDIEMIYSGLRPGEKLYEELLIDAKAEKTDHPKIYRAREKSFQKKILFEKLTALENSIYVNDLNEFLIKLKEIVPEWENSYLN